MPIRGRAGLRLRGEMNRHRPPCRPSRGSTQIAGLMAVMPVSAFVAGTPQTVVVSSGRKVMRTIAYEGGHEVLAKGESAFAGGTREADAANIPN